jgi:hypothetical protein
MMKDMTGTPRSTSDIEAAIESEMIRNPMAMSKMGEPLLLHYMVIRDVLKAVLKERPSEHT